MTTDRPKPIITSRRRYLLDLAESAGGLSSSVMSKADERAAYVLTQMSEPLLRHTYWGPFDYTLTEAGHSLLTSLKENHP